MQGRERPSGKREKGERERDDTMWTRSTGGRQPTSVGAGGRVVGRVHSSLSTLLHLPGLRE